MILTIDSRGAAAPSVDPTIPVPPEDLLRHGQPRWVRRLSGATRVTACGVLLFVTGAILAATVPGSLGAWVGPLVGVAGAALWARGAWVLTAADPSGRIAVGSSASRWSIRAGMVVGTVAWGLQAVAAVAPPDWQWQPRVHLAAVAGGAIGAAAIFALCRHLASLALRVPNPLLARRARFVGWGVGVAQAGSASLAAVDPVAFANAGVFRAVAIYTTIFMLVALVVYGVMCLHLLRRVGRALSIQADFAQGLASRVA